MTVEAGTVTHVGPSLPVPSDSEVVDGAAGALVPGLWDHHIHVVALAAARRSVLVGPPAVADVDALTHALRDATAPGGWVRAVGYHESVAGLLDRHDLDRLAPGAPVRVQHRSGACWILSDAAVTRLGLDDGSDLPAGVERDATGRPTGRVYGEDRWLRNAVHAAPHEATDAVASGLLHPRRDVHQHEAPGEAVVGLAHRRQRGETAHGRPDQQRRPGQGIGQSDHIACEGIHAVVPVGTHWLSPVAPQVDRQGVPALGGEGLARRPARVARLTAPVQQHDRGRVGVAVRGGREVQAIGSEPDVRHAVGSDAVRPATSARTAGRRRAGWCRR